MKIYIEYGWPEGKWHAKMLVDALIKSNFEIVTEPGGAEIIIAHSGGCYMLSKNITPKLVLHIGLPNWPGRLIPESTLRKWSLETRDLRWFKKLFYQGVYFFNPITTTRAAKAYFKKTLHDYPSAKTILIRNELDTYMHPDVSRELAQEHDWEYLELPGMHDDIWEEPQTYVDLIRERLNPLAR